MIVIDRIGLSVLASIFALWIFAAAWLTLVSLRRMKEGRTAEKQADRAAALLAGAPTIAMKISADGQIEADDRLATWLGIQELPRYLSDLGAEDGPLLPEEAALLARDATAAQRAGRSFSRSIRVKGSRRVMMVRGQRASDAVIEGGAVLWFFDSTESLQEIERLEAERAKVTRAIEALSALIEAAPFPMWHRGPDLKLVLVNTAYVRAVEGDSAADVVARGLELTEQTSGVAGPLVAAGEARDEGRIIARTAPATIAGERRMIRIVDVPLGTSGVAGYAVDVEELEEARADLGRFVRAQRDLLDRLSAGVVQFGADRNLIFWNQPFLRLFQLQAEWIADRPEFDRVLERMRETQRVPESRDFPSWKAERRAWFTQGDDPVEEAWLLPAGVHLRVVAQPLPDGGLLLIFEDRTEQLQLASARDTLLRVRTATFENLFEAIGVFAVDGRLNLWNNRFRDVWGLSEETLAKHPRVDVLVDAVAKRLHNPGRATLIRELVRVATLERQQRSGRVALADGRHFEFAAVPLPDGNALFTMLDISASRGIEQALRERNEALEEADKLKTAFVSNMSYELRVPLTSIGGFAEMLKGGYAGDLPPTARDYIDAIISSVGRLSTVIENILDLTQSEAGSLPIAADDVDLVPLAGAAAHEAEVAAHAKRIDFIAQIDPAIDHVTGDSRRLRQALDHVLRNAVAYTPEGGRVLFRATIQGQMVELVISDNGVGISLRDRERIFDRFHRASERGGDGQNGNASLGIGLPLTRQLIEAHGGELILSSELDEGTTVTIRLPRPRKAHL